ncbi:bactericidal permeability-increasing protein-like [Narcine bancroftii]|uniref:bactericidal permeability-increasing protein-like n=1 Tax=Narcine bancroftii TaxID=1343680 RepID=UPI0038311351
MQQKMYLAVCVMFILIGATLGKNDLNPGIQSKITQKGLEYGRKIAITIAQKKIKEIHLPEISGDFGPLYYHVTGWQITDFGLPVSDIGLIPNIGVKLSVKRAHIGIRGNWDMKYLFIRDKGTFNLNINDLSAVFAVSVSMDSSRPMIRYNRCDARLENVDLKLHGRVSWIYNLFIDKVKDKIHQIVPQKLCSKFSKMVGELEAFIQKQAVSWQLDKYVEFDYSLVGEPEITTDFIDFPIKGELYDVEHHTEAPFSAKLFNLANITDQMLVLGLSDYFFNTGSFAYFRAGALQVNITDDMISKYTPFHLSTSSLGMLLPKVAKMYPNLLMKIVVHAEKPPVVKLIPGKFASNLFFATDVYVILPNNSLAELFLLSITASVYGQMYISEGELHGSVSLDSLDLVLEKSKVGTIPTKSMKEMLILELEKMLIPKINAILKKGFLIPKIDKISLINPVFKIGQGLILIGSDIQYEK